MITAKEAAKDAGLCDDEWKEAIESVSENDFLDAVSAGVLKQIIGQGIESLSPKQQYVYRNKIKPALTEECADCANRVVSGKTYCPGCEIEYGE